MALPLQILPAEETFGGKLGTALGTGIGSGLQNLAQIKLNEIAQRQQEAQSGKFWQELGLPASIGSLPPQVQKGLLDRLEGVKIGGQQTGMQNLQQMGQTMMQEGQQIPQQGEIPLTPPNATNSGNIIGPNPIERRHREDIAVKKEAIKSKERESQLNREERAWKAANPSIQELLINKRQADKDIQTLDYMNELEKTGNLISPQAYTLLQKAGLDFPMFYNSPESEAYEKASQSFLRNAKQIYGGRVTNFELEQFLKQVPTLRNTPEGRKLIQSQWRLLAQTNQELFKAQERVLKKNNNVPPNDFNLQVEKEAEKKLNKLSKKFNRGLTEALGGKKTYGEEGLVPDKKQSTMPTGEGTQFLKNGVHMIIENGRAIPYEERGKAQLTTVSF